MNFVFILITACVVSIDAMVGGFALALKNRLNLFSTALIGLITFIMCLPSALLGGLLSGISELCVNLIGAGIFLVVGLRNIFSFKSELSKERFKTDDTVIKINTDRPATCEIARKSNGKSGLIELVLIGIAVGFDAAVANLSISMMGNSSVWVCAIFAAAHILFVGSALLLTKLRFVRLLKKFFWLPGAIIIGLAVYKIVNLFF